MNYHGLGKSLRGVVAGVLGVRIIGGSIASLVAMGGGGEMTNQPKLSEKPTPETLRAMAHAIETSVRQPFPVGPLTIQWLRECADEWAAMREALLQHRGDLHCWSRRPCGTCRRSAEALGISKFVPDSCATFETDQVALSKAAGG